MARARGALGGQRRGQSARRFHRQLAQLLEADVIEEREARSLAWLAAALLEEVKASGADEVAWESQATTVRHYLARLAPRVRLAQQPGPLDALLATLPRFTCGRYAFSTDWFVRRIPWLCPLLAPLVGAPGLQLLEVGCFEGRSTVWFLENLLTHATSRVTCVDVFAPGHYGYDYTSVFERNLQASGAGHKVRVARGRSVDVLPTLAPAVYHVAFLDGSHAAPDVLADGVHAWRLLAPGGLLIFDDYTWKRHSDPRQRPRMAIDAWLNVHAGLYDMLLKGVMVAVRKR